MASAEVELEGPSRRSPGAGFALATQPVAAGAVVTDDTGLVAGDVSIPAGDRAIGGYRARPAAPGKHPLVLVVQEIFGVHEHIRDLCRRLAKQGYFALAPELFERQGDVKPLSAMDEIRKIVNAVPDAQVLGDLDAAVAFAAQEPADLERIGITGFCWGGRETWLYAAHSKRLKAAVAWYGRLAGDKNALRPRWPVELGDALHVPVLGLYGGKDHAIPQADVETMKGVLASGNAAARASELVVYPEAGHAFNADYRPNYEPRSAADGWSRMLAWFKAHGV